MCSLKLGATICRARRQNCMVDTTALDVHTSQNCLYKRLHIYCGSFRRINFEIRSLTSLNICHQMALLSPQLRFMVRLINSYQTAGSTWPLPAQASTPNHSVRTLGVHLSFVAWNITFRQRRIYILPQRLKTPTAQYGKPI